MFAPPTFLRKLRDQQNLLTEFKKEQKYYTRAFVYLSSQHIWQDKAAFGRPQAVVAHQAG